MLLNEFSALVKATYNPDGEKRGDFYFKERIRTLLFYTQQLNNVVEDNKEHYFTRILVCLTELAQNMDVSLEQLMTNHINIHKEAEENANKFSDNTTTT